MTFNKNIFLVKNLYNYEKVIPPPPNIPDNFVTVYVTDNDINYKKAKELGWDIVKKTEEFLNITDKFDRRKVIAYINSFPHKIVPEILDYKFVFVCDSNIVRLWDNYKNFTETCSEEFALFITTGYYSGERDTIMAECNLSASLIGWSYNKNEIINSTKRYVDILTKNNVNLNKLSVVSAKYIGWNLKHEKYDLLSNILYNEGCENLQGNIILTYMSGLYPNIIYNYKTNDYSGGALNSHNYSA
jgi:hypothetical protein